MDKVVARRWAFAGIVVAAGVAGSALIVPMMIKTPSAVRVPQAPSPAALASAGPSIRRVTQEGGVLYVTAEIRSPVEDGYVEVANQVTRDLADAIRRGPSDDLTKVQTVAIEFKTPASAGEAAPLFILGFSLDHLKATRAEGARAYSPLETADQVTITGPVGWQAASAWCRSEAAPFAHSFCRKASA